MIWSAQFNFHFNLIFPVPIAPPPPRNHTNHAHNHFSWSIQTKLKSTVWVAWALMHLGIETLDREVFTVLSFVYLPMKCSADDDVVSKKTWKKLIQKIVGKSLDDHQQLCCWMCKYVSHYTTKYPQKKNPITFPFSFRARCAITSFFLRAHEIPFEKKTKKMPPIYAYITAMSLQIDKRIIEIVKIAHTIKFTTPFKKYSRP